MVQIKVGVDILIPYGKIKGGSGKIHPHNECYVCDFSEDNINKKRARGLGKKGIIKQLNDMEFENIPSELANIINKEFWDILA